MKVPISWLKEYIDITLPIEDLAYRLTLAGLEVDSIDYIGVPAGEGVESDHLVWDRDKLVVGYMHEVKPHPDADKLVLAMVDDGTGDLEQVVTGAPNLLADAGAGPLDPPLAVAFAREGAELVDPYSDDPNARFTLTPKTLRGIDNRHMVCSEKELGVSDEHEGIMILRTDAAPGTPLQDALGDAILNFELTPNLARAFSIIGIAREVAALTGQEVRYPSRDVLMEGATIEGQAALEIREPSLNARFTLSLIKDVEIKPSPDWLQRRLRLAGQRPISNMVDVTNYVMLETGQPLHAFDFDILVERAGGAPTIITRLPDDGEKLTTLDDVERELDPFTILVADTAGALSLGGIMGGEESEIHDDTTNILLEAASWNYINIRQTLQAQRERNMEMTSEAGARFSRGVHPAQASVGLLRATEMMRDLGGGRVAEGIIDAYPLPAQEIVIDLPMAEVTRLVGIDIPQEETVRILQALEFIVEEDGDNLRITVPDHRLDIGLVHDVEKHGAISNMVGQADLIEEIARVYGYDRIPPTMIDDVLPPQRANEPLEREEKIRDALVRAGLQEVINYRLTTPEREARLTPEGSPSNWPAATYVTLANPLSMDRTSMRHTLLAGMLETLALNARWQDRQAMFEIGKVYLGTEGENLPAEPWRLAIAMTGYRGQEPWHGEETDTNVLMDYYDLKGVIEALIEALHLPRARYEPCDHSTYFPGRTACLYVGDDEIGTLGELHPLVADTFDLPDQAVMVAELDLDALRKYVPLTRQTSIPSPYPVVYQDIAIVVDEALTAADVEDTIRASGGSLLQDVRLFDVYRGDQIEDGKKSLAYALTFQSPKTTLTDKAADAMRGQIQRALKEKFGATLRA